MDDWNRKSERRTERRKQAERRLQLPKTVWDTNRIAEGKGERFFFFFKIVKVSNLDNRTSDPPVSEI